jgi:hypothetical protein
MTVQTIGNVREPPFLWAAGPPYLENGSPNPHSIQCWGEEHRYYALLGMVGFVLFVPIATLVFGMDKVLFPQEKVDIQYAPIMLMITNVVKMLMMWASSFFPWIPFATVSVGAAGNLILLIITLSFHLVSLRWVMFCKVAIYISAVWCAGCGLYTVAVPRSRAATLWMYIGFFAIWLLNILLILYTEYFSADGYARAQAAARVKKVNLALLRLTNAKQKDANEVEMKKQTVDAFIVILDNADTAVDSLSQTRIEDEAKVKVQERDKGTSVLRHFGVHSMEHHIVVRRLWQMNFIDENDLSAMHQPLDVERDYDDAEYSGSEDNEEDQSAGRLNRLQAAAIKFIEKITVHRREPDGSIGVKTYRAEGGQLLRYFSCSSEGHAPKEFDGSMPLDIRLEFTPLGEAIYMKRIYREELHKNPKARISQLDVLEQSVQEESARK